MDEISRSLYNCYKNGEYFSDAKKWYAIKYLYPVCQRYILASMIILFTLPTVILYSAVFGINSQPTEYMYEVSLSDTINQQAEIDSIEDFDDPELNILEYLITKYVNKYESYSFLDLPKQFEYIKNNSEREVMMNFYHKMDLANDNSPILMYQKHTDVSVSNIAINFEEIHDFSNMVVSARFNRNIVNKITNERNVEAAHVIIKCVVSNIENGDFKQKAFISE